MKYVTLTVTLSRAILDHLHAERERAGFDKVSDQLLAQILIHEGIAVERSDMSRYIEQAKDAA